MGPPRLLAPD
uniref:Uncharacterized protein n=1 Tax=Arundo donax TaxID=35708 RepID=A0A0A9F7F0_ARUDO